MPEPFLSSYAEASGSTQSLAGGDNVAFDIDPASLDIVGNAISLDPSGSIFTITEPGLYHVEWSVNLESGSQPIILCLLEDGDETSAMSSAVESGNCSSGALFIVTTADIPLTLSLNNFGGPITIADPTDFEGTAASIRILRFADGPAS